MDNKLNNKVDFLISEVFNLKKILLERMKEPAPSNFKKANEEMVDSEIICTKFKISKKTLYNYREKNLVPFHKIAGKVYFYVSEVEKALKEHYYGVKTSESDTP